MRLTVPSLTIGLDGRQQNYVRTLQSSADHLLGLINDILDFSKLEAGQMKIDPIRFNLLSTIEDVFELVSTQAREKNLELLLHYSTSTPRFVTADPGRIRQVLLNLIGNAIKFTDQGYIMVHVDISKDLDRKFRLDIRVEDTGIGIPEDKVASLFEKFMQVESGSTRARQGTGLGLAISRNLIKLMGGDIIVTSKPGKGTTFSWYIPVSEAGDPEATIPKNIILEGKRILLVDDLAPNRILFKEVLTSSGLECLVAENYEEALSVLNYQFNINNKIDAIITDHIMPGKSGVELTRNLKKDEKFKNIPVLIFSCSEEHGLVKLFDDAGADACLIKPITRQHMLDTLAHVLDDNMHGKKHTIITSDISTSMSARKLLAGNSILQGSHILLVEDNKVNMEIMSKILSMFGCQVTVAENGLIAVEAVRTRSFDLIFMDCQMPEMDGFEAARIIVSLKAEGKIDPVPIVALTANALKEDRERCLESGMDDYLSKPVRKSSLEAILLKWLREKLEKAVQNKSPEDDIYESIIKIPSTIKIDDHKYIPVKIPSGVDIPTFKATKDTLGDKIGVVIGYYLEDAENYMNDIVQALKHNNTDDIIRPAHTLKSSSKQFGITSIADMATHMELIAREGSSKHSIDSLSDMINMIRSELIDIKPFLQSHING